MDNLKFNEFKCEFKREGGKFVTDEKGAPIPVKKELTARGHVMITPQQAEHYNRRTAAASGILYILADEKQAVKELEKMNKEELTAYVNEKGYEIDMTQTKAVIVSEIREIEKQ